jgi:hypothetical protein
MLARDARARLTDSVLIELVDALSLLGSYVPVNVLLNVASERADMNVLLNVASERADVAPC